MDERECTMKYIPASADMADSIRRVLHETIRTVYPKYYPAEVAEFFCNHHSREHVLEGIASGNMGALVVEGEIVGTGCYDGNHITGLYVLPGHQNRGYGSLILKCLEERIAQTHDTAVLDASLPAVFLYERRGYRTTGHGVIELENGARLVYEIMERKLG